MVNYDALISQTRGWKFKKLRTQKDEVKVIDCCFDQVNGHVEYGADGIIGPCSNRGVCELNPLPSRYKHKMVIERENMIEEENRRAITFDGETVVCSKKNCSQFGMYDLCRHGVPHEYSGSCMMRCERFTDAYCDIGGC